MRITNGMIAANTLRNINKAANRMAAANEAVSSNMKIQLASDDPTVATRAVTYRSYVSQVKQYQDNVDSAQGWQKATDDALSDLSDDITTLKTLTNQASSTGTLSDSDLSDIKARVKTLKSDIISLMNTDYSGSYIFGGYSTGEAPYEAVTTTIGDAVTYKGDYLSLGSVISSDISDADIKAFYSANEDKVYDSLSDAAASALSAANTAQAAATADPTSANTALAAKAKATSDALATAVTSYGGTTTLTAAATFAKTDYTALTTAVTAVEGNSGITSSTKLSDAVTSAETAYNTAKTAADADPGNTTLAAAVTSAKTTWDTLASAETTYGSDTTIENASNNALTFSNTLDTAVTDSEQNITYNIGFNSEATVNIEGQDVTGEDSGSNLFDTIQKLQLALDGDTTYKTASLDSSGNVTVTTNTLDLSDLLDEFSTDLERVTVAQAKLGANMNIVDNASDRLDSAYESYKALMTDNENVDTAAAASELTSSEYTYEAALAVGAKVTTKSLIDYIA